MRGACGEYCGRPAWVDFRIPVRTPWLHDNRVADLRSGRPLRLNRVLARFAGSHTRQCADCRLWPDNFCSSYCPFRRACLMSPRFLIYTRAFECRHAAAQVADGYEGDASKRKRHDRRRESPFFGVPELPPTRVRDVRHALNSGMNVSRCAHHASGVSHASRRQT